MNVLVYLLVSTCYGQQQSVLPVPDLKSPSAQTGMQQALDSKFSVYGGTMTGMVSVSTVQRVSEICWVDATCQTSAGAALSGTNSLSGSNTLSSGSTIYFTPNSVSNLCGECGGVMITSMTLNNTFRGTFSGFGINMSTRTYCMEFVYYSTNQINSVMVWLNNYTGLIYSQTDFESGASVAQYASAYLANAAIALGPGNVSSRLTTAGTYQSGIITFHAISSTSLQGFINSQYNTNSGAACGNTTNCTMRSNFHVGSSSTISGLAAIPTRIDFCTNSVGAVTAPDCLTPMQSGHFILCAEGWRPNP